MEMVRIFSVKVYHIIIFLFLSKFMSLLPIKKGKIVVLNLNIAEYKNLSKTIAAYLKLDFQTEVLNRLANTSNINNYSLVFRYFNFIKVIS